MRYSEGASPDRAVRRMVLFLGVLVAAVTVAVGVVGLLAPISISSQQKVIGCGSALAPNLSAARAKDERNGAEKPVSDEAAPRRKLHATLLNGSRRPTDMDGHGGGGWNAHPRRDTRVRPRN